MALTVAKQVEIPLPKLHEGQRQVLQGVRRFNWLAAGRRWRKTTLCMRIAVEAASRRQAILWGAPTYDQVRVGWEEAKRAAGQWATFNESRMEARFPGGGKIFYRSLDNPNNARGHTADGCVIDEASFCPQLAWYEVIRPMLMDTGGWAWQIFTPNGRNFIWQEWTKTIDGAEDSAAWQAPSLGVKIVDERLVRCPHPLENPTLPFSEIKHLYETMPERSFRQEILAEFVEDGGGVFRGLNRVCVLQPAEPVEDHLYTVGVDWGRSNDFTVVSVIDITSRPARQVKLDRFSQIGYEVQLGRLRAILDVYQPIAIVAELNSMGGPLVEHLQTDGYPVEGFQTTSASKKLLVEDYALAIERADVLLLDNEVQKLELESITGETLPGGMIRYAAPSGLHDDTMIAGGLAWQRAKGDYFSDEEESEDEAREREWNEQLEQRGGKMEKRPGLGDPRKVRGKGMRGL